MNPHDTEAKVARMQQEIDRLLLRQSQLESQLSRSRGLYDLAIALTTDHDLDENLHLVVDKCRALLPVDISYIALLDERTGAYSKHTYSGIRTEAFRRMRPSPGMGLGGLVMERGKGCAVVDYLAEVRLDDEMRAIVTAEGIASGMAVPLQMAAKPLGLLYAFNRVITEFSPLQLETLALIGHLAAVEISRKQTEQSLRESEERFRFMAETTGDVIYRLRYDSMTYDYLSPGIARLTGYSAEEIHALGFSRLVKRIDRPGEEDVSPQVIVRDRLAGRVNEYRADYLIQTRWGETRWLRDHSFPWVGPDQQVIGSVGILSDVTGYKRAEMLLQERTAELIESEEKYRTLVENVPLVVYRITPEAEVVFVNQFAEQILGYTPAELMANPALWGESVHDEDQSRVEGLRWASCREGREFVAEYRIRHRDGSLRYVIDHAIPLTGADGAVGALDGIIMDITWRVQLQEKLVKSEGERTITEISARLAHEIRNPLMSAGGFARRLLATLKPDDPNHAWASIIVKEVGRLEVILKMILNYIQPLDLHLEPVNLRALVDTVTGCVKGKLRDRMLRVETALPPGLPEPLADRRLMSQVLETLFFNAVERTPPEASLRITAVCEDKLLHVLFSHPVRDISQDALESLLYPFPSSQVPEDRLDLPMVRVIANKHGGDLTVERDATGHVVMRLSLPLYQKPAPIADISDPQGGITRR